MSCDFDIWYGGKLMDGGVGVTGSGGIGVPPGFTNAIIGGRGDKWEGQGVRREFYLLVFWNGC